MSRPQPSAEPRRPPIGVSDPENAAERRAQAERVLTRASKLRDRRKIIVDCAFRRRKGDRLGDVSAAMLKIRSL